MIEELEVEKGAGICREKKVVFWRKAGKLQEREIVWMQRGKL